MALYGSGPSHKPRKRRKDEDEWVASKVSVTHRTGPMSTAQEPPFPLAAFLWPARGGTSQWVILPLVLMVVGLFRWSVGFWGYSGFESPPMHGDFEAQRHWMEITTQLPISLWYFYDLEWWGLDYPPLTAYHSWLLGKIGSFVNPSWFALYTSRGLDDPLLKVYMRATVIASEYLVYMPAVICFCRRYSALRGINRWEASIALVAILMQPATILIDHAHFQYNTVMLGFVVASMTVVLYRNLLWTCVFFVAALGFKQMALYYAPAVFAYLLGSCVFPRVNITRFFAIALITAISFALLFAPLLLGAIYDNYRGLSTEQQYAPPLLRIFVLDTKAFYYPAILQLAQSIHRVFPFARGLFEDKVANFWCAVHTFHKLHHYPISLLQRLSLGATAAAILPPCLAVLLYPERTIFPYALAVAAWGFFLFSFQVHEKSVLLPLLPMTLLLSGDGGLQPLTRSWLAWANILASWTLFPLLKRDQLRVPYFVLTLLWAWLMGVPSMLSSPLRSKEHRTTDLMTRLLHGAFYLVMIAWHVLEASVLPPEGKPDLWVVVNVLVGAAGFAICYLWCLWKLWEALPTSTSTRHRNISQSAGKGKPKSL